MKHGADENKATFEDLLELVSTLRSPGGCPWDAEQDHKSLRPYLLEETYEALEAIESCEPDGLAEELGDLLIQVAFHVDVARRSGEFDSSLVISRVMHKLTRRHPHVFGDAQPLQEAGEVAEQWEELKRKESGRKSIVDSLPASMPALSYATSVWSRAVKAGLPLSPLDAPDDAAGQPLETEREAGRYLMMAARMVQAQGHDPETVLRAHALRLRDKIRRAEKAVHPRSLLELSQSELEQVWEQAREETS